MGVQSHASCSGCSKTFLNKTAGEQSLSTLLRGGWDDPNCARPTRAFSSRALREQGDHPSYSASLFSTLLCR